MFLKRIPIAIVLIAVFAQPTLADVTVIKGFSIRPVGASPVGDNGNIYKLEITPAKESYPAFKHRFTVPPHETIPGNAITHYLRSLGERGLSRPWEYAEKETDYKIHDWYSIKTKAEDIPMDKFKLCSKVFDGLINNHMSRATLCRNVDWGLAVEDLKGPETIGFLLPSVQGTREMAQALQIQIRLAIIEKRFDDAIDRLRMVHTLGQNVNELGFLVSSLVGVAEVGIANEGTLMLISQDDAPNLYWALAELPVPVIDQRKSLRLESSMAIRMFPELMDLENANYSKEKWKALLSQYIEQATELQGMVSNNANIRQGPLFSFAAAMSGYGKAKNRLIESHGYEADTVKAMSVAQVLLTDAALDIQFFSQQREKAWHVPFEKSKKFDDAWEKELALAESQLRLGAIVVGMFSPAVTAVRTASTRAQARTNILMAIESLRNHAALHGTFPESLDELDLPVRANPFTGKPFNYSLEADKAVLTFDEGNQSIQRYEISIKQ